MTRYRTEPAFDDDVHETRPRREFEVRPGTDRKMRRDPTVDRDAGAHAAEDDLIARPRRRRGQGFVDRAVDAALRNPVMAAGTVISGLAVIIIVTNALANQPMRHPSPLFATRPMPVSSIVPVATQPIIVGQNPLQPISDQPVSSAGAPRQPTIPADADQTQATLQPAAPTQPAAVPPLANLSTQLTERIQQALHERGFYAGAVDGLAGPATAEAIKTFEQRMGVAATGEVNDRVLALLRSARGRQLNAHPAVAATSQAVKPVPVSIAAPVPPRPATQLMPAPVPPEPLTGSTEGRLQKVQRALNIAGYGMLRTDGRLDDKTVAAIRKFEAEHDMPITGKVSDKLASMLIVRSAQAQ